MNKVLERRFDKGIIDLKNPRAMTIEALSRRLYRARGCLRREIFVKNRDTAYGNLENLSRHLVAHVLRSYDSDRGFSTKRLKNTGVVGEIVMRTILGLQTSAINYKNGILNSRRKFESSLEFMFEELNKYEMLNNSSTPHFEIKFSNERLPRIHYANKAFKKLLGFSDTRIPIINILNTIPINLMDELIKFKKSNNDVFVTEWRRDSHPNFFIEIKRSKGSDQNYIYEGSVIERSLDLNPAIFFAGVVHSLKNKLTTGTLFLELLIQAKEEILSSDLVVRAERLLKSLKTTFSTLNVFENLFKNFNAKPETIEIQSLFDEILEEHGDYIKDSGAEVELDCKKIPNMVGIRVLAKMALENYVLNAVKHRGNRNAKIQVGGGNGGSEVRVWVRDNGPGISRENIDRLFQPGGRLVSEGTDGNGLGLYVAREAIRFQGGRVWVESKVGKGSTFYFSLPVAT